MGKTNKPITIWVCGAWEGEKWVEDLREKGHTVWSMGQEGYHLAYPDLILHPSAHMWKEGMLPMLEIAIKAARERKYEPK